MLDFLEAATDLTTRTRAPAPAAQQPQQNDARAELFRRHEERLLALRKACDAQEQALTQLSEDFDKGDPPDDWVPPGAPEEESESSDDESDEEAEIESARASLQRVLEQPRWRT
mmetsp:Transcript_2356/g.5250  ORF Transcript_2356/g.5250 Transcript_2356/m.5250 type:complete len:114 (-) Transcript_2356:159-500(-)|eukprot:3548689-Prymnesium_polylepis.1